MLRDEPFTALDAASPTGPTAEFLDDAVIIEAWLEGSLKFVGEGVVFPWAG